MEGLNKKEDKVDYTYEFEYEETEEDDLNRLKNKKKSSNAITDFLNGLK